MKKSPFFSVIIPTYNRFDFVKTAIESVLKQSFDDFELIVNDDGSNDDTSKLQNIIKDHRFRYIRTPHKGVSHARNIGIKESKSKHICFLDSDDKFKKNKLKIAKEYIEKCPKYMIFHTEELWYRYGKVLNQKKIHKKPDGYVFNNSLKLCCIGLSTTVVKKELFEKIGYFDEDYPACEDYELWLRATSLYPVKLIPHALTIKQGGHEDQLSKKFPAMDTLRIKAITKLLNNWSLKDEQKKEAIKALKRKCIIYIKGAKKRGKLKEVKDYEKLMCSFD